MDRFAWPGGYQINYLTADNSILCAACAQEELDDPIDGEVPLLTPYIIWDGAEDYCEDCNEELPPEYT